MGLLLSVIISYAGVNEAIETIKHILSGMVPEDDPDFQNIVDYYSKLLHKTANPSLPQDWITDCSQGYLCLNEDEDGKLKSAAVKYYGTPDSTAILFSTKISSFGQESTDSSHANGDYRSERYTPNRTKTIVTNTSDSINIGYRNRSPTSETVSDPPLYSESSFERDAEDSSDEKLTWHYRPKSPIHQPTLPMPEIHFQVIDDDQKGVPIYNEEFLRSLDGIKFRPLQRTDPSGRRRSFKKRHSSSSTSSRESRASREEELKMFTSLEEAEFESMNKDSIGGSSPNLEARSYSRSHSREHSKERKTDNWSMEGSVESAMPEDPSADAKPRLQDIPNLGSFEEEPETKEVTQEVADEEDLDDFWGSGD